VGTGFHPELTGRENIYLSGAILGMTKREIDQKFDEIVTFSGVEPFLDTPLKHYSVGMQMRLAFAVAAHLEPEILLVDEVLAVGDLEFQKKCLGKMEEVSRSGRTVLFVSHQMNQIRRLCERVIWLDGGRIVREGPTHEVVSAYEAAMTSGEWLRQERPDASHVKARFLKWEIVEPRNDQPNVLLDLGPVTIRFLVRVNKESKHWHHSLLLLNADGQKVWGVDLTYLRMNLGLNELVYSLPYLPIKPGQYRWLAVLWDEDGLVDLWEATPELLISIRPFNLVRDERVGLLNLPFDFFVKSLDE
jgi:lipopolysaccharide transport system ATP-binding protein